MTFVNFEHSVSVANGQNPAACLRPVGLADGDTLIAVVTVPTLATTSATVTPPAGWSQIDIFHAVSATGMGVSQAWFVRDVPTASEVPPNFLFTASNIGASRVLVQVLRMSGLDVDSEFVPTGSQARSTSTTATPTGSATLSGPGEWDLLYAGSTRSGNAFTAADTLIDNYNPAANTSSGIFFAPNVSAGTVSKAITADTASSTGLGVIIALPHLVIVPPRSPYKTNHEGELVDVDLYIRENGALIKLS